MSLSSCPLKTKWGGAKVARTALWDYSQATMWREYEMRNDCHSSARLPSSSLARMPWEHLPSHAASDVRVLEGREVGRGAS